MILNVEGIFELIGKEIFVEYNQDNDNACLLFYSRWLL